ncbi:peptidoglycan glycosyltransferase [Opitutaceae bacterium EW11]|nr:peptidoglycan glycosyltransferase [Opitutaceae bacterium EW11]
MPAEAGRPSSTPAAPSESAQDTPHGDRPAARSPLDSRLRAVNGTILAGLLLLAAGFAYEQLVRSEDYSALERRQIERRLHLPAPRGAIYDREHRLLAGNRTRFDAVLHLGALRDELLRGRRPLRDHVVRGSAAHRLAHVRDYLDRINTLTGRHEALDQPGFERHFARERALPYVLVKDLDPAEAEKLAGHFPAGSAVEIQRSEQRWYPQGNVAAHVLGRVRWEPIRQRPALSAFANVSGTRPPDDVGAVPSEASGLPRVLSTERETGVSGIELQFDDRLAGTPGEALLRVDALGYAAGSPTVTLAATPGEDVTLSLDLDLHRAAERALAEIPGRARGAAVAIDVQTGEVLALISKPDFDLNAVSPQLSEDAARRAESDGAWFNLATQGLYPPGSTFKIFTALAGFRRGTLQPDTVYRCDGFLEIGGRRYSCHQLEGHGSLTLRDALAHSCNVYAVQVGLAAGPEAIAAEARLFHFDRPSGVQLPGESFRMLVPDPSWKKAVVGSEWTPGDTANLSIGQGYLRITPLQAACAIASLARRETLTVPTLLHQPGRLATGGCKPEPLAINEPAYAALIDGLREVVETGIGREAQVPGVRVAGKTGTAQVQGAEGMFNVAWFVGFAPLEHPEIAVAVALQGSEPGVEFAGGHYAAPVAREILGAYFDKHAR